MLRSFRDEKIVLFVGTKTQWNKFHKNAEGVTEAESSVIHGEMGSWPQNKERDQQRGQHDHVSGRRVST